MSQPRRLVGQVPQRNRGQAGAHSRHAREEEQQPSADQRRAHARSELGAVHSPLVPGPMRPHLLHRVAHELGQGAGQQRPASEAEDVLEGHRQPGGEGPLVLVDRLRVDAVKDPRDGVDDDEDAEDTCDEQRQVPIDDGTLVAVYEIRRLRYEEHRGQCPAERRQEGHPFGPQEAQRLALWQSEAAQPDIEDSRADYDTEKSADAGAGEEEEEGPTVVEAPYVLHRVLPQEGDAGGNEAIQAYRQRGEQPQGVPEQGHQPPQHALLFLVVLHHHGPSPAGVDLAHSEARPVPRSRVGLRQADPRSPDHLLARCVQEIAREPHALHVVDTSLRVDAVQLELRPNKARRCRVLLGLGEPHLDPLVAEAQPLAGTIEVVARQPQALEGGETVTPADHAELGPVAVHGITLGDPDLETVVLLFYARIQVVAR
mmetsp:Transcript_33859/g.97359  ORF Transcript_33859/g.97359 Transcript_33859/m.97359 type:complete len:428 (-) Transcript_33859:988-2271(-)